MTGPRITDRDTRQLALTLADIQRRLRDLERGGGRTTTIEGSLTIRDPDTQEVVLVIGQQPDGSVGTTAPVAPSNPPAPSAPSLDPTSLGVIVRWDGTWANGTAVTPADVTDVEVHYSPDNAFTDASTRFGSVARNGGSLYVPLPPGTYWFALRARTQSGGGTFGAAAQATPGEVNPAHVAEGADAQVLTTVDGVPRWYGNAVLLLDAGASVPQGTPPGTVIVQKAE